MNQSYHDENEHKIIMDKAKELAGRDEASLLAGAEEAQKVWNRKLESDPDLAKRYEADRDRQFMLLQEKLRKRKAESPTEEVYIEPQGTDKPAGKHQRKKIRLNKKLWIGLIAAAVLVAGGSMASTARNGYRYQAYPDLAQKTNRDRHNIYTEVPGDTLDQAYREIEAQLHIPAVMLGWRPKQLRFVDWKILDGRAIITFEYQGERVYLKETPVIDKRSTRAVFSDRKPTESLFNHWLQTEITVETNELKNGKTEYSAEIINDKGYYYFCGVMERDTFVDIVSQMMYQEK